jgi:hypothetical protein
MARSTFEGPILQGNNRFGPLRNVGYVESVQSLYLSLANVTNATAGYAGSNQQFVGSNVIPNTNAVVYTPSATASPPTVATITADTGTIIYRGGVMYLPYGSIIRDVLVDVVELQTLTTGTVTGMEVLVSNGFTASAGTARYATLGTSSTTFTAGRQISITTNKQNQYTTTQLANMLAGTTGDITNPTGANTDPNGSLISQVVVTLATNVSGADGAAPFTAGKYNIIVRYTQPDPNIGSQTTYPYGNFD